jgi:hypothetical protein
LITHTIVPDWKEGPGDDGMEMEMEIEMKIRMCRQVERRWARSSVDLVYLDLINIE